MMELPPEIGDQIRGHKQAFYNSGYSTCYKCGRQDLRVAVNPVGISGTDDDEFGIDVFTCNSCPWVTSFKWSSSYPQRYTEPVDGKWQRTMLGYPSQWVALWCQRRGLAFMADRLRAQQSTSSSSSSIDGAKLMDWERRDSLQRELKLTDAQAEQLRGALSGRDFSLKT